MDKFNRAYYNKILKEADKKGGTIYRVHLSGLYIKELPSFFRDLTVEYDMDISYNLLTSCKNFPIVYEVMVASDNNITSLDGLQTMPYSECNFYGNKLTSLEYLSRFNSRVFKLGLVNNNITSLKGLENLSVENLLCSYNDISSFEYHPKLLRYLNIRYNKLTGWKGMPSDLTELNVSYNWNVTNFDDYKYVKDSLSITSTIYTRDTAHSEILKSGENPPQFIYLYRNEQI
jgi:hypothetical protein